MNNPKNESKKIQDLISDVRSQLINIEESMGLAEIAAYSTDKEPHLLAPSLGAFMNLVRPIISYAVDQLEDAGMMLNKDSQNEENA